MRIKGLIALFLLGFLGACSGSGRGGVGGQDGRASEAGPNPDSRGPECAGDDACAPGICLAGHCCASLDQVCGDLCCAADSRCLANTCVRPGKVCFSAGDCAPGEYCEPALGTPSGGNTVDPGHVCLQPAPSQGRCLASPKRCALDKDGKPIETGDCLPPCEVRPDVGKLDAVTEWVWDESNVATFKNRVDVWSTPVIARVTDTNCDGVVNELDPPNIIFVSGNARTSCCSCGDANVAAMACNTGVLRVLDGATGQEILSINKAESSSAGFLGNSLAAADIDRDGNVEIIAITAEGYLAVIDRFGKLKLKSDTPLPGATGPSFGWGGALAIADMEGDGFVEIAYQRRVYTTKGGLTLKFDGDAGKGPTSALSFFSDVTGDGNQELITCGAVFSYEGKMLWRNTKINISSCYGAAGDFNKDGKAEVAFVGRLPDEKDANGTIIKTYSGELYVVDGKTGDILAGPKVLPGTGSGGPPTIADFDGDGAVEVGVAKATYYSVTKVLLDEADPTKRLPLLWKQVNHDFSSSVTSSTVFDFEGDGQAEVIYNDECFLWVYDGKTGAVKFATPTTSFTANEASLVADVDGDGRAEMVMIANRADPSAAGWKCKVAPWTSADAALGRPAWTAPPGRAAYSGITVWGDRQNAWVGTRKLWNQSSYHVTNVCDSRDDVCSGDENKYGVIPKKERPNWQVPWLNNFRQNVQDKGIFDAPDASVSLRVACKSPTELRATLRNLGLASLPKGIAVGLYVEDGGAGRLLTTLTSTAPLLAGQAVDLSYEVKPSDGIALSDYFFAEILSGPGQVPFRECRADNNKSAHAKNPCVLQ